MKARRTIYLLGRRHGRAFDDFDDAGMEVVDVPESAEVTIQGGLVNLLLDPKEGPAGGHATTRTWPLDRLVEYSYEELDS
jgi:hypothetical protein